jgi:hypothetical protein
MEMGKKTNKTLYLPDWVIELVDKEGEKFGGPGAVAAASIFDFCRKNKSEKKRVLKEYTSHAIEVGYEGEEPADSGAEAESAVDRCIGEIKQYAVRYHIPGEDERRLIRSIRGALGEDRGVRAEAEKRRRRTSGRGGAQTR